MRGAISVLRASTFHERCIGKRWRGLVPEEGCCALVLDVVSVMIRQAPSADYN